MSSLHPKTSFLILTKACNLHCPHCYVDGGRPAENELTTQEWKVVIDELKATGVKNVRFEGGEPLLRRDCFELIDYTNKFNFDTAIVTNSSLLSGEQVKRLAPKLTAMHFSLDGATKETHDALRGKGVFDCVVNGIKNAKREGVIARVFVSVSKINSGEVEKIIDFVESLQVDAIAFFYCSPFGRGRMNWKQLLLEPPEWMEVCKRIEIKVRAMKPRVKVSLERRFLNHKSGMATPLCSIDKRHIATIDSDGEVYFCSLMITDDKRFSLGNVRNAKFSDIWEKSHMWNVIKDEFKAAIETKCSGCRLSDECKGGCIASTLKNNSEFGGCGEDHFPICFVWWDESLWKSNTS